MKAHRKSVSTSHLPTPELVVFSYDSNDWKMSLCLFKCWQTGKSQKKMRRFTTCTSMWALTNTEIYFLLRTESAYHTAWEILEERYERPFVICNAFRDKRNSWSKIGFKDRLELLEFADFFRGCALPQVKSLDVLSDCNENQKIISKLLDWLTSRCNQ